MEGSAAICIYKYTHTIHVWYMFLLYNLPNRNQPFICRFRYTKCPMDGMGIYTVHFVEKTFLNRHGFIDDSLPSKEDYPSLLGECKIRETILLKGKSLFLVT